MSASPFLGTEALRGRRVLALSPHSDDLALSLGGVLSGVTFAPPMIVVTVFAVSRWVPGRPDLTHPREIGKARIREDQRYCSTLGARLVTLPFADSGVRGYDATTELTADLEQDPIRHPVTSALHRLVHTVEADLVLAPLGLGGHIDHRVTVQALLSSGIDRRAFCFYEDLPYAAEAPFGSRPRVSDTAPARALKLRRTACVIGEEGLAAKLRGLDHYPSQIRQEDRTAVMDHARQSGGEGPPSEVLWTPVLDQ